MEFPGLVKMKYVLFKCDWFDPTENKGVRYSKFGVVDINATRRYNINRVVDGLLAFIYVLK